eukprot:c19537_g1_i1.p1 GENE.c19537_g1_i1~~c19537_g1_i1.p1  ORF type:complete len:479 (+),score=117.24 c19537_g1_i1:48-1484(+)
MRAISRLSLTARRAASSSSKFTIDNPYTLQTHLERPYTTPQEVTAHIDRTAAAQKKWKSTPLAERVALCQKFIDTFDSKAEAVAKEITASMGKPLRQSQNEVKGMYSRIRGLIDICDGALQPHYPSKDNRTLRIEHEAVGTILAILPWNYPLLTAANAIFPALLAGSAVLMKHSPRTSVVGDLLAQGIREAGFPEHLVTSVHPSHETVANTVIPNSNIRFVTFTGSVAGGREVYRTVASQRFIDVTLELGGKDSSYVSEDADIAHAVDSLVDGGMYNAGQSCCGVKRIYVHERVYDEFVSQSGRLCSTYVLGDPMASTTTLGPVALPGTPEFLEQIVQESVGKGGRVLCGGAAVRDSNGTGRFFAPTLVADCNHGMKIMKTETFGPLTAIQRVKGPEEAIEKMNDSDFGLTASIYSKDHGLVERMARELEAGTVFMNRCDSLDPTLAWTGVKNTGKGCSLSVFGFRGVTQLKSYNVKL